MNKKDKLYYDLIEAYRNHSCNDTLIDTYIYKVLKIVKDYLGYDNLKKENEELLVNKNFAQGVAIKYKKVIEIFWRFVNFNESDHEIYFKGSKNDLYVKLTQEEYDLLKEVLNNDQNKKR